jgi:hypothetical protein
MLKHWLRLTLVLLTCSLLIACGKEKRMADAAILSAEREIAAAGENVGKYAPDQWKQITDALASAKDSAARKDYKAAIASLEGLGPKIQEAQAAASTRKTELENAWNEMSAGLPKMVDAIKSRVDALSASRKLPAGLDKARLDEAKASLAAATTAWSEATTAYGSGDLVEAVNKANAVKDRAAQIMQSLGMSMPAAMGGGAQ